jgi:hypothetical protein
MMMLFIVCFGFLRAELSKHLWGITASSNENLSLSRFSIVCNCRLQTGWLWTKLARRGTLDNWGCWCCRWVNSFIRRGYNRRGCFNDNNFWRLGFIGLRSLKNFIKPLIIFKEAVSLVESVSSDLLAALSHACYLFLNRAS